MSKPIYIIGHRNPDSDSICSAIGYAHLKQAMGDEVIPARAGKLNAETKFLLKKFGVEAPKLIMDFYPRVKDVMTYSTVAVHPTDTLRELGKIMREHSLKSIPVIDEHQSLVGIVSVGDLAKRYFDEIELQDLSQAGVDFLGVLKVLDAKLVTGENLTRKVEGKVGIAASRIFTILKIAEPGDIMLASDNIDAQMACIEKGVACLVITSDRKVENEVKEAAARRGVIIMQAPYDTYTCARLINQSIPISMVMQTKIVTFKPADMMSDTRKIITGTNYRSFPVVENNKLVGFINRDHLIMQQREKVILVDHNERSQAVEGIEDVKIIEIIDHHRLGGLQTGEPIFIRHDPVGSTATIVANLHWHRAIDIPPQIAGLLLGAIISDTMLFKSPTATENDREVAEKLAKIAGLDVHEFGLAVLHAGSGLGDMTTADMVAHDMKEFQIGEYRVSVSQMSVMDPTKLLSFKDQMLKDMEILREKHNYDMVLFMITDIINECTHLVYSSGPSILLSEAFDSDGVDSVVFLPGVMSRKKQVIPPMVEAATRKML